jgi:glycosyltransferase involved in cell wall biosynthesis
MFDSQERLNAQEIQSKRLLYFVAIDWFFYSHFLDRAIAAKKAGYDVTVVTASTQEKDLLSQHEIRLITIPFSRSSLSPIRFILSLINVVKVYRSERPDIVHQIALKPILIGTLAARIVGIKRVINSVVGLGYTFTSETLSARSARFFLSIFFRWIFKKRLTRIVFENIDDLNYFVERKWINIEDALVIRGAGIDTSRFSPKHYSDKLSNKDYCKSLDQKSISIPIVMLLSRMLWDKGIGEFVESARIIRQIHGDAFARFVLVGDHDDENRASVGLDQLQSWKNEGYVEWWGFRPDVEKVLAKATISCLPSYREGLPKSLLESLSMGLPCVTTDVPGCRETVVHGHNGFLVPPRDSIALARAIEQLINSPNLIEKFGLESRRIAINQFSSEIINKSTIDLYNEIVLLK